MYATTVLCGTYHKEPQLLARIFRELEATSCRILSPLDINFVDTSIPIVRTADETDFSIDDLERFHLRAMRSATFIWLHDPAGHVGISAAFEIGYALALGKPVFCLQPPADEMLATRVQVVSSVFEALDRLDLIRVYPTYADS